MTEAKKKSCKGTGKAKSMGCGILTFYRKYGLCPSCLGEFLFGTEQGKEIYNKTKLKVKKKLSSSKTRKYIKWTDKPFNEMQTYVQENIVNPYIRLRDNTVYGVCISSGNQIHDAGHYYSRGSRPELRYCIQNIHGQNRSDNSFKGGNLVEYTKGLINRFGESYLKELQSIKIDKLTRSDLINIGKTYEHLTKKQIWCFSHVEFLNYNQIVNK